MRYLQPPACRTGSEKNTMPSKARGGSDTHGSQSLLRNSAPASNTTMKFDRLLNTSVDLEGVESGGVSQNTLVE